MNDPIFDPTRDPLNDMREALARARQEHKNVLVDIGGDWCVWCQRLEAFIAEHPVLAELRDRHYITVRVYVSDQKTVNEDFLRRIPPFKGVPHLFVYNPRGLLLCSQETEPFEVQETYDYDKLLGFFTEWADWRRSPFDALTTDELRLRFGRYIMPESGNPTLSA